MTKRSVAASRLISKGGLAGRAAFTQYRAALRGFGSGCYSNYVYAESFKTTFGTAKDALMVIHYPEFQFGDSPKEKAGALVELLHIAYTLFQCMGPAILINSVKDLSALFDEDMIWQLANFAATEAPSLACVKRFSEVNYRDSTSQKMVSSIGAENDKDPFAETDEDERSLEEKKRDFFLDQFRSAKLLFRKLKWVGMGPLGSSIDTKILEDLSRGLKNKAKDKAFFDPLAIGLADVIFAKNPTFPVVPSGSSEPLAVHMLGMSPAKPTNFSASTSASTDVTPSLSIERSFAPATNDVSTPVECSYRVTCGNTTFSVTASNKEEARKKAASLDPCKDHLNDLKIVSETEGCND